MTPTEELELFKEYALGLEPVARESLTDAFGVFERKLKASPTALVAWDSREYFESSFLALEYEGCSLEERLEECILSTLKASSGHLHSFLSQLFPRFQTIQESSFLYAQLRNPYETQRIDTRVFNSLFKPLSVNAWLLPSSLLGVGVSNAHQVYRPDFVSYNPLDDCVALPQSGDDDEVVETALVLAGSLSLSDAFSAARALKQA